MTRPAEPREHAPMPMVLFVALPANLGGSNRSLLTLITALRPSMRCVLAAPAHGSFRALVSQSNVIDGQIELPYGSRWKRLRAALVLAGWATKHRTELTAIHAQALTGLNVAALAAFITRVPLLVRVSDPIGSRWGRFLGPVLRRLLPDLRVAPVSEAAALVAVDNGVCRFEDCRVIPNPIDSGAVVASARQDHSPLVRIGYLGGLSQRKGFDLLPGVVQSLLDLPVTWMVFLNRRGSPETDKALQELKRHSSELVQIRDRVKDVRVAYAVCDVVFVPSRAESFCRVAAESMLNGLPVVATDIPALRALVGNEAAGLLFPAGDSAKAAEAIRRLVLDPELRQRLGENGRVRGRRFEPRAIASELLPLYGISSASSPIRQ